MRAVALDARRRGADREALGALGGQRGKLLIGHAGVVLVIESDDRQLALAATYAPECVAGSPRACNELGILAAEGLASTPLPAPAAFARACSLGLPEGCSNAEELAAGGRNWRRPAVPDTAGPNERGLRQ